MLLKAGTYRFNNVVIIDKDRYVRFNFTSNGIEYSGLSMFYGVGTGRPTQIIYLNNDYDSTGKSTNVYDTVSGWYDTAYQDNTILNDIEADDDFGTWYIANTNYNEVNPTVDTIYTEKSSWYKSVADAIRNKKGTTAPILRDDFASEISSITGGGETPYYDGTVIIEKAESVLGLRRIKDSWFTNYIANVGEFNKSNQDELQNAYNQYGFEIEPIEFTMEGVTGTLLGLTVSFAYIESDVLLNTMEWVLKGEAYGQVMLVTQDSSFFRDTLTQFTVKSVPNKEVEQWLLANTEGVSV